MWDPKPDAPGPSTAASSASCRPNVPGIRLGDMLPMCGRIMDKWSIVRSLHHHDAGHSSRRPDLLHRLSVGGPNPDENVDAELRLDRRPATRPPDAATAGLRDDSAWCRGQVRPISASHRKPFETQADPANSGPISLPNFALPQGSRWSASASAGSCSGGFDPFAATRRERPDEWRWIAISNRPGTS